MRSKLAVFFSLLLSASVASAATVSGSVTNKTTGKPSAGDTVELVDVQQGMAPVAKTTSDSSGHYSLTEPGSGPYLVRVTHQGATYFIAAPQGGASGDVSIYDAAPKVNGISLEDEIMGFEATNNQLEVTEQFVLHNTSSPKITLASDKTFEFVLPEGAILDVAEATRPSGIPTMASPKPLAQKNHYAFSNAIEPDQGDKNTLFQIHYHLPYNGQFTFHPQILMPTDNFAIQMPKAMKFTAASGLAFQPIQRDPSFQIFLLKNALPGKSIEFTISGVGQMPRDSSEGQQGGEMGGQAQSGQPGGGIGEPINTPDPLTKYKWWILGALALLLAGAAAFLLRKPAGNTGAALPHQADIQAGGPAFAPATTPANKREALLNALKEELFNLESERLSGTIAAEEYAEQKAALETVLKRALNRK